MAPAPPALFSVPRDALRRMCVELGYGSHHADLLRKRVLHGRDPALPPRLAAGLASRVRAATMHVLRVDTTDDGARKHLLALHDGETIEAVRLPGTAHASACLSTQVGCAMACRFCASGLLGVRRQLAAHELLEQVVLLRRDGPVARLVLMGTGEPTQNLRAVGEALLVLRDEGGIGPRHVLLSTVGPPAAIERVGELGLRLTLALSLHALDRDLRGALVPTQVHVEPRDLLDAADRHAELTGRPYQVEWVLLGGQNDSPAQAADLAVALRGRRAHVSAIAWNAVEDMPFARPASGVAEAFVGTLRAAGISAALRRSVGGASSAACGQLRIAHRRDG
ncbi:MAG: radical SAM protein [Planctomycetes bacterium]|nr:radical SAM protein [Planctomycetota bacterium]